MAAHPGSSVVPPTGEQTLPLAHLLGQLSRELDSLARIADDVQNLTATLTVGGYLTAEETRRLQQLDLLTQTLDDLTKATGQLVAGAPDCCIDGHALALTITLSDLRARLTGKGDGESPDDGVGTVAMF